MAEDGVMKVNLTCVGKNGRGEIQFKYQGCGANPGQEESIKELNDKLDMILKENNKNSEKLEKILNNTENVDIKLKNTEKFDEKILNQTENNSGKLEEILNFWASGMFMFKTSAWLD